MSCRHVLPDLALLTRATAAGLALAALVGVPAPSVYAGGSGSFVNWESSHVHPLDLAPGGGVLVAVNTADNRLEVFRVDHADLLYHLGSVPVGLDPVSVRARTGREIWVVNHISDSVSIVDLDEMVVTATIPVGDEPNDVVFARDKAFVSVGTDNALWVYDLPYDPAAAPTIVPLDFQDPRALATDGETVFALALNAGNRTSVLNHSLVTNPSINPHPGAPNPPPNDGSTFNPPINPNLLIDDDGDGEPDIPLPRSSMILKQTPDGVWFDDNGMDWSAGPFWDMHGRGLAHVNADSMTVSYTTDLMAINFALDVDPASGDVAVVGTHANNHIRFEPNLNGRFIAVGEKIIDGGGVIDVDPNPHLTNFHAPPGSGGTLPPIGDIIPPKDTTIGDPRGVAWHPSGAYRLITGRGSNNLAKLGASGARLGTLDVGQGPTGVVIHGDLNRAYVLNHFDATISVINPASFVEVGRFGFYDPTPDVIRVGRPHFYNTHDHSLFGDSSCASCHIDGDKDLLAWDLGDPSGEIKEFNQTCIGEPEPCENADWHPMKGPMTTQSLFGIVGEEPLHWRGDREDLAAFNPAFVGLLGSEEISDAAMAEFEAFVATLTYPPNPYRERDGELATSLFNGGNPQRGAIMFGATGPAPLGGPEPVSAQEGHLMAGGMSMVPGEEGEPEIPVFNCVVCHALPTGSNNQILRRFISDTPAGLHHLTKTAQLRDLYTKDGFDAFANVPQSRGTGYLHDGSLDDLITFLTVFFGIDPQDMLDLEAFLLSFGTDTHAGVGSQATTDGTTNSQIALRNQLIAIANGGATGLTVKGLYQGERRGFAYVGGGLFQTDREDEIVPLTDLSDLLDPPVLTYTLVPLGTETRIGIDRDEDGFLDGDELDACSDPANPDSFPGSGSCCGDIDGNGTVAFNDLLLLLSNWGRCSNCAADIDHDGHVTFVDLLMLLSAWGPCAGT